jgi:hypothetical protein
MTLQPFLQDENVNPQLQVLPKLFPTDLEDRSTLAEMEVLQLHTLDQLSEIELSLLVQDVNFYLLVTVALSVDWFVNAFRPDLQNMALAVLVKEVGGLSPMNEPTSRDWARDQGHDLLKSESDLFAHWALLRKQSSPSA